MSIPSLAEIQQIAIVGDLEHKLFIYDFTNTRGAAIDHYLTAQHQSEWLRKRYPHYVPPRQVAPPSDHTVSTHFEYRFVVDRELRSRYLIWFAKKWIAAQNVI